MDGSVRRAVLCGARRHALPALTTLRRLRSRDRAGNDLAERSDDRPRQTRRARPYRTRSIQSRGPPVASTGSIAPHRVPPLHRTAAAVLRRRARCAEVVRRAARRPPPDAPQGHARRVRGARGSVHDPSDYRHDANGHNAHVRRCVDGSLLRRQSSTLPLQFEVVSGLAFKLEIERLGVPAVTLLAIVVTPVARWKTPSAYASTTAARSTPGARKVTTCVVDNGGSPC